ncbi:MAG: glycosyl hydrolase family 65 protein, partial [Sphingomonadales bacterium]|jgi:alpha,alpha-trehalose phosphorylase
VRFGAEMLFETARIWPQIGFFNEERGGRFCINMVTGPDEYTALVNNNLYTNVMAKAHLLKAVEAVAHLKSQHPDDFARLVEKLNLSDDEISLWRKAAEQMELAYDEKRQLFLQDDRFLERKIWDFANTPDNKYPLLLHYAPLEIYRHQVCKQADAVLAAFLQKAQFAEADRKRIFDYYESVTVHDSTLSPCVFSTVAADVGELDKAVYYLTQSALVDIEDLHGNASHGVHMASSGGSWMALINGFAGMEVNGSDLSFAPKFPNDWAGYEFRLRYQDRILELCVDQNHTTYRLIEGESLPIRHCNEMHMLNPGQDLKLDLAP